MAPTARSVAVASAAPEAAQAASPFEEAAAQILKDNPGRKCYLVTRDGQPEFEINYITGTASNTPFQLWSVTKSLSALLVGRAEQLGLLRLGDALGDFGPVLGRADPTATVEDALRLVSLRPARSIWEYDSDLVINNLNVVLRNATARKGLTPLQFAQRELLAPLQLRHTTFAYNEQYQEYGDVNFGYGSTSTCRDLATVGQLVLQDGVWQSQRLLSRKFMDSMWTPGTVAPSGPDYGLLWWLVPPQRDGPSPYATIHAAGLYGQAIIVSKDHKVVVTSIGHDQFLPWNPVSSVWTHTLKALGA